MHWVFEPGFFSSQPVHVAFVVGGMVAVVSAVVGRVHRHAGPVLRRPLPGRRVHRRWLGAFLVGISPLFGFVAGGVVGAGAMEMIGVRRARGRDLATGIVLGRVHRARRPVPLP